jgi:hypothetical protein
MELALPEHIFEKSSNFIKYRPLRAEFFHAEGQTDGQAETGRPDEANNRFSQFYERA